MGKSVRWFYSTVFVFLIFMPTSIVIYISGESYGLYNSNNRFLIILNYVPTINFTVLLLVLFVHLEYTTSSRQKYELKDKYSHNLGNILQVIYSSYELLKRTAKLGDREDEILELIEQKSREASKLIKEIREL